MHVLSASAREEERNLEGNTYRGTNRCTGHKVTKHYASCFFSCSNTSWSIYWTVNGRHKIITRYLVNSLHQSALRSEVQGDSVIFPLLSRWHELSLSPSLLCRSFAIRRQSQDSFESVVLISFDVVIAMVIYV
jgi:hypothetical protein